MAMPGEFVVKAGPARENANLLEKMNSGVQFVPAASLYSAAGSSYNPTTKTGDVYVTIPDIYVRNPITGEDVRAVARQTVRAEVSSAANAMTRGY